MLFLTLDATLSNLHFVDMQCVLLVCLVARGLAALRDGVRDLVPLAPVVLPPCPAVMSAGRLGRPPSLAVPPQNMQVFCLDKQIRYVFALFKWNVLFLTLEATS